MTEKDEFMSYFRKVQPKFSRVYSCILAKADLTLPQYALLSQLAETGETAMTEISCKLHVSKPAITNLVDRLEQKKLLKRTPHPKDRRVHLIQIQPKGEKTVRDIQGQVLNLLLKTLDQLSATERKSVVRFYALISKTLDELLSQTVER